MTGDLVSRKLSKAFAQIDVTGNGVITRDDLLTLGNQMLSAFREDMASPKATAVFDAMIAFWDALSAAADQLTRDEFTTAMRTTLLDDQQAFDTVFAPMAQAILLLTDFDGDGHIGREEFTAAQVILGTPVDEIAPAFNALDTDQDGRLSLDELLDAIQDFYATSDPSAPGNVLFGSLTPLD